MRCCPGWRPSSCARPRSATSSYSITPTATNPASSAWPRSPRKLLTTPRSSNPSRTTTTPSRPRTTRAGAASRSRSTRASSGSSASTNPPGNAHRFLYGSLLRLINNIKLPLLVTTLEYSNNQKCHIKKACYLFNSMLFFIQSSLLKYKLST